MPSSITAGLEPKRKKKPPICAACGNARCEGGGRVGSWPLCWKCFESFSIWLLLRDADQASSLPEDRFAKYSDLVYQMNKAEWGREMMRRWNTDLRDTEDVPSNVTVPPSIISSSM